jgi:hypothetical protein
MMRRVFGVSLVLFLAVAVLLVASTAFAGRIKPNVGIAGVKLGYTEAQATGLLGQPDITDSDSDGSRHLVYGNRVKPWLDVGISPSGTVVSLFTRSRKHVTPSGVRIGMSPRKVRRRLRGEHCDRYACVLGSKKEGHVFTDFGIFEGKLDTILIGLGFLPA